MKVYVVIARVPQVSAGYLLLGTFSTEEKAEEYKKQKLKNSGLFDVKNLQAIDVWESEVDSKY